MADHTHLDQQRMNDWPTYMSGSFDLGGWHFERYEPANGTERRQVNILATSPETGESVVRVVPLFHPNLFGLDVEDAAAVEDAIESLVTELGLEDEAGS